jgi:hypothetical protein
MVFAELILPKSNLLPLQLHHIWSANQLAPAESGLFQ